MATHGLSFGRAAFKEKPGRNVLGGTPNTACETHALPESAVARSDPLETSRNRRPLSWARFCTGQLQAPSSFFKRIRTRQTLEGIFMDPTPKRALVASVVTAGVVTVIFGTPEFMTELFLFFALFFVIWFVLFTLLRSRAVKAMPPGRRHVVIWLVAAGTGVLAGLLPKALSAMTR